MILACDNNNNNNYRLTRKNISLQVCTDLTVREAVDLFTTLAFASHFLFVMAMTKRSDIGGKIVCQGKARGAKKPKYNLQGSPGHNNNQGGSPSRLSPVKGSPSLEASPRSSPGLVAGYYAGCKFTEPPSASALPLPPKHWVQTNKSVMFPFRAIKIPSSIDQHQDFTQQLKLLLKVQA